MLQESDLDQIIDTLIIKTSENLWAAITPLKDRTLAPTSEVIDIILDVRQAMAATAAEMRRTRNDSTS